MAKKINLNDLAQLMKALSSKRRLQILSLLKKSKNTTVSDIAKAVGIEIATASQHLRSLRMVGIVKPTRRGKFVAYRLALQQEEVVREVLKGM